MHFNDFNVHFTNAALSITLDSFPTKYARAWPLDRIPASISTPIYVRIYQTLSCDRFAAGPKIITLTFTLALVLRACECSDTKSKNLSFSPFV